MTRMPPVGADQMALWAEKAFRKGMRKANEFRSAGRLKAKRDALEHARQLKAQIAAIDYDLGARTPEEREADRKALARISTLGRSYGGVHGANRGGVTPGLT